MSHTSQEPRILIEKSPKQDINRTSIVCTPAKNLFRIDQEVFVDAQHTLVLVNDFNLQTPGPASLSPCWSEQKEKKSHVSIVFDTPASRRSLALRKSFSMRKKSVMSQSDSQERRMSNTISHRQSEISGREPSKTIQEEVDVFKFRGKEKQTKSFMKILIGYKLDSIAFNMIMALVTVYALFLEDLSTAIFTKSADMAFDVMSLVAFVAFLVDMILSCYAKKGYRFTFFFWLDLISTFSLILDVDFIMEPAFYSIIYYSGLNAQKAITITDLGTKIGKLFRVVRLVRLVKFYKTIAKGDSSKPFQRVSQSIQRIYPEGSILAPLRHELTRERASREVRASNPRGSIGITNISEKDTTFPQTAKDGNRFSYITTRRDERSTKVLERIPLSIDGSNDKANRISKVSEISFKSSHRKSTKESRVGKKLAHLTTKRTIIIVLVLMLVSPLFSGDLYFDSPRSQVYQMTLLSSLMDSNCSEAAIKVAIDSFIQQSKDQSEFQLVFFKVGESILYMQEGFDLSELRWSEDHTLKVSTKTRGELVSIVSDRKHDQFDSLLSIGKTVFIFLLLTCAALLFYNDTKVLLLIPLERIISKVNKLANDPLVAKEQKLVDHPSQGFHNEAIEIENAIIKIGGLLALGFGDAGSSIITQNMASSGDINPMLPGKKKAAIYGFCDIRNFTDVTEILQEDVMLFVNSIADIVHSVVDKYGGTANKNIGDAFLLVWKFPEGSVLEIEEGQFEILNNKTTKNFVDAALISFLKIYAKINRDPTLLEFRNDPRLNERLPNYKVKIGFGLHIGWSIEGAIGSHYKIDASYLSPNVNMASRLEAATKQYGVPLLFSGELYEMLSDSLQENSRLVDVVTVKGSKNPTELYTIDLDVEEMPLAKERGNSPIDQRRHTQRKKKEYIRSLVESGITYTVLETDKELRHMLRNKNKEFDELYHAGFSAYVDGEWALAKKNFDACLAMRNDDGPTKNLSSFIAEYDYIAPDDWNGYRVLHDK